LPVAPVTRILGFGIQTSIGIEPRNPLSGSLSQIHGGVAITLQVIAVAQGALHRVERW